MNMWSVKTLPKVRVSSAGGVFGWVERVIAMSVTCVSCGDRDVSGGKLRYHDRRSQFRLRACDVRRTGGRTGTRIGGGGSSSGNSGLELAGQRRHQLRHRRMDV